MKWTRGGWALLVAGMSWLGCIPPPPPEEEPKPPPTEVGDWVDMGRFASCGINPSSGAACGAMDFFKMDGCDAASVAAIPNDGVYTSHYRYDLTGQSFHASASFRLSQDGHSDYLLRYTPSQKVVGPSGVFLAADYTLRNRAVRHAIRACRADGTRIYGCFVYCRDGQMTSSGTFEAARAVKPENEEVASAMQLVSETFVAQGLPVDIYVAKGHAYVVSANHGTEAGGLSVYDVSDKAHPVLKKVISVQGDSYWNGVWAKDDALYVASGNTGVVVFNISNPADPVLLRSVPSLTPPPNVHTVFVDGNRLYAMSPGPLPKTFIFDVTTATEPVLVGEYAEPGADTDPNMGYPHDALAFEGRLYINHWSGGFLITDVSDPASVKKLGAYTYPWATSHANAVGRYGNRVIAFEGGEEWGAHLRVLDVTDASQPKLIGEYRLDARASIHNMLLRGSLLYIAHYQHGVRVLDVSTPERPKPLAHYHTFRESDPDRGQSFYEGAIGIRVPDDGYVYVVDTSRGLLIFPESSPLVD